MMKKKEGMKSKNIKLTKPCYKKNNIAQIERKLHHKTPVDRCIYLQPKSEIQCQESIK